MNKRVHRWLNTSLILLVLSVSSMWGKGLLDEINAIDIQERQKSEMVQIVSDEGFRRCVYDDSKGFKTVGFGHLVLPNENIKCISPEEAITLLQSDYYEAWETVERNFPWADGEVKLVLANMSYQIGITKLVEFKKTIKHLKNEQYTEAAMEMIDSKWYRETPERAMRLTVRILALQE